MRIPLVIMALLGVFLLPEKAHARLSTGIQAQIHSDHAEGQGMELAQSVKYKNRKVYRSKWGTLENSRRKTLEGSNSGGFRPKSKPVVHKDPVLSQKAKFVSLAPKSQVQPAAIPESRWGSLLAKMKWIFLGALGIGAIGTVVLFLRPT